LLLPAKLANSRMDEAAWRTFVQRCMALLGPLVQLATELRRLAIGAIVCLLSVGAVVLLDFGLRGAPSRADSNSVRNNTCPAGLRKPGCHFFFIP
jgi:hypothetical protein